MNERKLMPDGKWLYDSRPSGQQLMARGKRDGFDATVMMPCAALLNGKYWVAGYARSIEPRDEVVGWREPTDAEVGATKIAVTRKVERFMVYTLRRDGRVHGWVFDSREVKLGDPYSQPQEKTV